MIATVQYQLGWPEFCGGMGQLEAFARAVCAQVPGCFSGWCSGGGDGHNLGVVEEYTV